MCQWTEREKQAIEPVGLEGGQAGDVEQGRT